MLLHNTRAVSNAAGAGVKGWLLLLLNESHLLRCIGVWQAHAVYKSTEAKGCLLMSNRRYLLRCDLLVLDKSLVLMCCLWQAHAVYKSTEPKGCLLLSNRQYLLRCDLLRCDLLLLDKGLVLMFCSCLRNA